MVRWTPPLRETSVALLLCSARNQLDEGGVNELGANRPPIQTQRQTGRKANKQTDRPEASSTCNPKA